MARYVICEGMEVKHLGTGNLVTGTVAEMLESKIVKEAYWVGVIRNTFSCLFTRPFTVPIEMGGFSGSELGMWSLRICWI